MTKMRRLFYFGVSAFLVGVIFTNFETINETEVKTHGLTLYTVCFIFAFVAGIAQLMIHLNFIFKNSNIMLGHKILIVWVLVSFALISGYILSLICLNRRSEDVSSLFSKKKAKV